MSIEIRAAASPGEVRVAVLRDGAPGDGGLWDYAIERPGMPDGVGDVHRGRVVARVAALAGSFVEIEGATGFLPDSEARGPEGTVLGVRVTRAAHGGKGPRLAAVALPPGEVGLVSRGPSPLAAMQARYPGAALFTDSRDLGGRFVPVAFDEALEAEVAALAEPELALPGGGRAHVAITPALTAIDVDLAGFGSAGGKAATHRALNLAAIPALVRAMVLRNLGGAILVDFAGLPGKRRKVLGEALAAALAEDPLGAQLLGFSHVGLAEIRRPRIRAPLAEMLRGPHAAGLAALRVAAREAAVFPARTLALRAAPPIVAALVADPVALRQYRAMAGRELVLRADPALAGPAVVGPGFTGWRLEDG